jgi:hypothetical protein
MSVSVSVSVSASASASELMASRTTVFSSRYGRAAGCDLSSRLSHRIVPGG